MFQEEKSHNIDLDSICKADQRGDFLRDFLMEPCVPRVMWNMSDSLLTHRILQTITMSANNEACFLMSLLGTSIMDLK